MTSYVTIEGEIPSGTLFDDYDGQVCRVGFYVPSIGKYEIEYAKGSGYMPADALRRRLSSPS